MAVSAVWRGQAGSGGNDNGADSSGSAIGLKSRKCPYCGRAVQRGSEDKHYGVGSRAEPTCVESRGQPDLERKRRSEHLRRLYDQSGGDAGYGDGAPVKPVTGRVVTRSSATLARPAVASAAPASAPGAGSGSGSGSSPVPGSGVRSVKPRPARGPDGAGGGVPSAAGSQGSYQQGAPYVSPEAAGNGGQGDWLARGSPPGVASGGGNAGGAGAAYGANGQPSGPPYGAGPYGGGYQGGNGPPAPAAGGPSGGPPRAPAGYSGSGNGHGSANGYGRGAQGTPGAWPPPAGGGGPGGYGAQGSGWGDSGSAAGPQAGWGPVQGQGAGQFPAQGQTAPGGTRAPTPAPPAAAPSAGAPSVRQGTFGSLDRRVQQQPPPSPQQQQRPPAQQGQQQQGQQAGQYTARSPPYPSTSPPQQAWNGPGPGQNGPSPSQYGPPAPAQYGAAPRQYPPPQQPYRASPPTPAPSYTPGVPSTDPQAPYSQPMPGAGPAGPPVGPSAAPGAPGVQDVQAGLGPVQGGFAVGPNPGPGGNGAGPAPASAGFLEAGASGRGWARDDKRFSRQDNDTLQALVAAVAGERAKKYALPRTEFLQPEGFDPKDPYFTSLHPAAIDWLTRERGIPLEVVRANRLFCTLLTVRDPSTQQPTRVHALGFPFFREPGERAQPVFVKYRLFHPEAERPFGRKEFRSSPGCEPIMYGLNHILRGGHCAEGYRDIIIVEGEMDKLALNAAGLWNVVSVPNGAPAARSPRPDAPPQQLFSRSGDPEEASARFAAHYAYLDSFRAALAAEQRDLRLCRFTLATDADGAGRALRLELMRRLGRERCWEVASWDEPDLKAAADAEEEERRQAAAAGRAPIGLPAAGGTAASAGAPHDPAAGAADAAPAAAPSSPPDPAALLEAKRRSGVRKDANDVLLLDGAEALLARLQAASATKLSGLVNFHDHATEITALFQRTDPLALGVSTGWPSLDAFFRVAPGEVTIVTGIPNSGKSEWLDALLVNLAENHGWAFCVCSMEKELLPHVKMLIEKRVRKPFRDYIKSTPTGPELIRGMSAVEMRSAFNWVADHFFPLRYAEVDDTGAPSIDWVLDMARVAVLRHGVRGLLIDPYNELDSRRHRDQSETEFIKGMLTKVRRFARDTECHVWFVAHPRQQQRSAAAGAGGHTPGMYDISGSAHWFNKTDNGIVVSRRFEVRTDPETGKSYRVALPQVDIKLQKVRNKDIGTQGEAVLEYDRATGRYSDPELRALLAAGPAYRGPLSSWVPDAVELRNRRLGYDGGLIDHGWQQGPPPDAFDVTLGPDDGGDGGGGNGNGAGPPAPAALPAAGGTGGGGAPMQPQYQQPTLPPATAANPAPSAVPVLAPAARAAPRASASKPAASTSTRATAASSKVAGVRKGKGGAAAASSTKAVQLRSLRERAAAGGGSSGGMTPPAGRARDSPARPAGSNGSNMGWHVEDELDELEEVEYEEEEEEEDGTGPNGSQRWQQGGGGGGAARRGFMEVVDGVEVPKQPEGHGGLAGHLLENEGGAWDR